MTVALRCRPLARVVNSIVQAGNGCWLDPSDMTTLYQDAAGTIPVTAVEQPVGLILDKSYGGMVGPNVVPSLIPANWIVSNADATHIITWLEGGGYRYQSDTTSPALSVNTNALTVGKFYEFTITISAYTSGALKSDTFGDSRTIATGIGTFTTRGRAVTPSISVLRSVANVDMTVASLTIKELYGYHATQSITAYRPTLSARYNLLTGTDTFSGWTTGNTTIVAGLLTATSTNTDGYLRYPTTQLINTKYSTSIEAKQGTTKWLRLRNLAVNNNVNGEAWFDLSAGVLGTVLGSVTAAIVDVGGGYFKCSITGSTVATISANYVDYAPSDADNTRSVTVGKTLYVRNPIHNIGELFLPYQRVNTATDYDTDPRYFPAYLRFDGVDDYLNLPYMGLYAAGAASSVIARDMILNPTQMNFLTEASTSSATPLYYQDVQLLQVLSAGFYIQNDAGDVVANGISSAGESPATAVVKSEVTNGANVKKYRNSGLLSNVNYTRTGTLTLNTTTIGATVGPYVVAFAKMKLYGLLITKSALSSAQRIQCERLLARKAGVTL